MSLRYTTSPLSDRTWLRPAAQRKASQFDSTWTKTKDLLAREIDLLGGRDVVIEVDVREQDIRNDGMLRANAKSASPAVVVAFETGRHGPMLYRCDRFTARWYGREDWQENVRAIALTLEALRAVDRYGATETGQQYAGFKALPAGGTPLPAGAAPMSRREAAELIERIAIGEEDDLRERVIARILAGTEPPRTYREARVMAHPDRRGGDHDLAYKVDEALRVLGVRS